MTYNWGALLISAAASLAAAVTVVVLAGLALVGWSARTRGPSATATSGALSPAVGTAVAASCLLGVAAIVGYGLWLVVG
ncbi:hypothetical protein [Pseudonocardia sp. GCM10023141]|uniref:hypothetical protein n=1 Tax=Pseudonocardia sp. GCM10023141 TaxID=3252653 RepID=UPI00361C045F